jgi:hypothetical protein
MPQTCRSRSKSLVRFVNSAYLCDAAAAKVEGNSRIIDDTLDVSDARRRKSQCTVCKRYISLTAAGVLFKHGQGCKGSRELPVEGSVIDVDNRSQQQQQHNGSQHSQRDDITTDDVVEQQ